MTTNRIFSPQLTTLQFRTKIDKYILSLENNLKELFEELALLKIKKK